MEMFWFIFNGCISVLVAWLFICLKRLSIKKHQEKRLANTCRELQELIKENQRLKESGILVSGTLEGVESRRKYNENTKRITTLNDSKSYLAHILSF